MRRDVTHLVTGWVDTSILVGLVGSSISGIDSGDHAFANGTEKTGLDAGKTRADDDSRGKSPKKILFAKK